MQVALSLIIAAVVIIILLIIIAFIWYEFMGWGPFTGTNGSVMSWDSDDVAAMRFKNCIFTVSRPDGTVATKDVSSILNGMAVAYEGSVKPPSSLALARPLNPFSFVIKGFNTVDVVPDPSIPLWANSKVTLTGKMRTLKFP
jgi:hypothetical protein